MNIHHISILRMLKSKLIAERFWRGRQLNIIKTTLNLQNWASTLNKTTKTQINKSIKSQFDHSFKARLPLEMDITVKSVENLQSAFQTTSKD